MMFRRITREPHCPVCKKGDAYRIKRSGLIMRVACGLLNLRPHYCPNCDLLFLGPRHWRALRAQTKGTTAKPALRGSNPHAGSLPHHNHT